MFEGNVPLSKEHILQARGVCVAFGKKKILEGLDLDIFRGEILGFVGGSGTGKSVLMRTILGLTPKQAGKIQLFGQPIEELQQQGVIGTRCGVLFQAGALFSSLTVRENIEVPLRARGDVSPALMEELALLKLQMVGLPRDAAEKFPSELSGGMIKRAALARALARDPDIVFLDEPTAGLDPIGASAFDSLILRMRDELGLTVYMVTHDLDSLNDACDRIAVLAERRVLVTGSFEELQECSHPWVQSYFQGRRAQRFLKKG